MKGLTYVNARAPTEESSCTARRCAGDDDTQSDTRSKCASIGTAFRNTIIGIDSISEALKECFFVSHNACGYRQRNIGDLAEGGYQRDCRFQPSRDLAPKKPVFFEDIFVLSDLCLLIGCLVVPS